MGSYVQRSKMRLVVTEKNTRPFAAQVWVPQPLVKTKHTTYRPSAGPTSKFFYSLTPLAVKTQGLRSKKEGASFSNLASGPGFNPAE